MRRLISVSQDIYDVDSSSYSVSFEQLYSFLNNLESLRDISYTYTSATSIITKPKKSSLKIKEIIVNGKTVMFKKPILFEIKDDPLIPGNKYIEDNFIYIHETASTEKELKEKVKEDIEIQWEDIVMEDDSKLSEGSIKLKEHLLSFV